MPRIKTMIACQHIQFLCYRNENNNVVLYCNKNYHFARAQVTNYLRILNESSNRYGINPEKMRVVKAR